MKRLLPGRWNAALRPDATTGLELPGEITRESRGRVRVAAAIGSAAYAVFLALEASRLVPSSALEHRIDLTQNLIGTGLCLVLLLVSGLRALSDRQVLAVALGIQVLLSLMISVGVGWAAFVHTGHVQSLTWVVPIMILFPLLVRVSPRTTLITSDAALITRGAGAVRAMSPVDWLAQNSVV